MRNSLQGKCKLFIENRDHIKGTLRWENSYLYPLAASIYTSKGQTVQEEKLRFCNDLLKSRTGMFSNFRGTSRLALLALLAVSDSPKGKLEKSLEIYDSLKQMFFSSSYLPVASMMIAELAEEEEIPNVISRTRHIYDLMKREHPFLTSSEDSPFAALLALSDRPVEDLIQEMEYCYQILKPSFFSGNAVQSLTHVLSMSEIHPKQKCERTLSLFQKLKEQGYRYGTGEELATLGVLALLDQPEEALVEDIIAADEYLRTQRGFGVFGIGSKQRLMYAGILAMCDRIEDSSITMDTAAISSVISIIIAEQAALCAAVAASVAAANRADSSTT